MSELDILPVGFTPSQYEWLLTVLAQYHATGSQYSNLWPQQRVQDSELSHCNLLPVMSIDEAVNAWATDDLIDNYHGEFTAAPSIVLVANQSSLAEQKSSLNCWHSHPKTRASGMIVIDFSPQSLHEENEIISISMGAMDYWPTPLSMDLICLKLIRTLIICDERDSLESLSETDALTAVGNRRGFDKVLGIEWRRAIRENTGLGLLLIDVDHFKAFNDFYGHLAGDDCLKQLASIVKRELLRPCDAIARYGGEEFVVLLPNINPNGVDHVANRIQAAIASANIAHGGSPQYHRLTVSSGLAWCLPGPSLDIDTLIQAADEALYAAKAGGRNQNSEVVVLQKDAEELSNVMQISGPH